MDAIAHTASPFHFKAVDPQELIGPAVQGTTGILKSAAKNAPSVKRIVVTSSCAAVLTPLNEPRVFSEEDWNEASIQEVNEKGKDASNPGKYRASKTLAERAAWEYYNQHKSELGWDLVVLNPPFVFGPFLHEVDKPENLNESAHDWFWTVVKGSKDKDALVTIGYVLTVSFSSEDLVAEERRICRSSYVDVRDLAEAHALAVIKPEAANERIIVSAGAWKWQDFGA